MAASISQFPLHLLPEEIIRMVVKNIFHICSNMKELYEALSKLIYLTPETTEYFVRVFHLDVPFYLSDMTFYLSDMTDTRQIKRVSQFDLFLLRMSPSVDEIMLNARRGISVDLFSIVNKKEEEKQEQQQNGKRDTLERMDSSVTWTICCRTASNCVKTFKKNIYFLQEERDNDDGDVGENLDLFNDIHIDREKYFYFLRFFNRMEGASITASSILLAKNKDYAFVQEHRIEDFIENMIWNCKTENETEDEIQKIKNLPLLYPKNLVMEISQEGKDRILSSIVKAMTRVRFSSCLFSSLDIIWDRILTKEEDFDILFREVCSHCFSHYKMKGHAINIFRFMASRGANMRKCATKHENRISLFYFLFNKLAFENNFLFLKDELKVTVADFSAYTPSDIQIITKEVETLVRVLPYHSIQSLFDCFIALGASCRTLPWLWDTFLVTCPHHPYDIFKPTRSHYESYWDFSNLCEDSKTNLMRQFLGGFRFYIEYTSYYSDFMGVVEMFMDSGLNILTEIVTYKHYFTSRDPVLGAYVFSGAPLVSILFDGALSLKFDSPKTLKFVLKKWHSLEYIEKNCPRLLAPLFVGKPLSTSLTFNPDLAKTEIFEKHGEDLGKKLMDIYNRVPEVKSAIDDYLKDRSYYTYVHNKKMTWYLS